MNEPKHPHFILSDAQYCHVLDDKLYIGKRELPEKYPAVKNRLDVVLMILQLAGALILGFFLFMTIITHYYLITLTLGLLTMLLVVSLIRTLGYTNTSVIIKADIVGVDYHKVSIGYDYFVVHYSGEGGKAWKRRLTIYDSSQSLQQALQVMKDAGLLKR